MRKVKENEMRKVKVMNNMTFALLSPFIFAGALSFFIADAVVFGWRAAEEWLNDF